MQEIMPIGEFVVLMGKFFVKLALIWGPALLIPTAVIFFIDRKERIK